MKEYNNTDYEKYFGKYIFCGGDFSQQVVDKSKNP